MLFCVVWGRTDDKTCIISSQLYNESSNNNNNGNNNNKDNNKKKLVIIPIVKQQQSALELHDFLLQTMTMTTSQNDDETSNSVMEIMCLQDVEEQAFQQARQLLTSL